MEWNWVEQNGIEIMIFTTHRKFKSYKMLQNWKIICRMEHSSNSNSSQSNSSRQCGWDLVCISAHEEKNNINTFIHLFICLFINLKNNYIVLHVMKEIIKIHIYSKNRNPEEDIFTESVRYSRYSKVVMNR